MTDAAAQGTDRRRSRWPWLVAAASVLVLLIVAVVVAERFARTAVEDEVRTRVVAALDLPADQPLDVEVAGLVLPQLIAGTLDELTVSSDDIAWGGLSGAVRVTAEGVAIRGEQGAREARARIVLDEDELRAVLARIDGFPEGEVTLDPPDLRLSTELRLFALAVPLGIELTPSADAGELVLDPGTLTLADATVDLDELRDRFGDAASAVTGPWRICLADRLPSGVTLPGGEVTASGLVGAVYVDPAIVDDAALQAPGTCR